MTRALALVLALVSTQAAPESTPASPVSVTATASKGEVTLGEAFTLELKATGPAGATYTFAGEASAAIRIPVNRLTKNAIAVTQWSVRVPTSVRGG